MRDRFGEKPLYILRDGEDLYFGSEVKFIASMLGRRLAVNERHLHRYLVNGYKALYKTKETFFAGVEELDAGTRMTIGAGGAIRSERYWTRPAPGRRRPHVVGRRRRGRARAPRSARPRSACAPTSRSRSA